MALFELSQSSERGSERQSNGNRGSEGGRIRFLLGKAGRREDSSFLIQGVFRPGGRQLHCL